jgi:hypothetical protein
MGHCPRPVRMRSAQEGTHQGFATMASLAHAPTLLARAVVTTAGGARIAGAACSAGSLCVVSASAKDWPHRVGDQVATLRLAVQHGVTRMDAAPPPGGTVIASLATSLPLGLGV